MSRTHQDIKKPCEDLDVLKARIRELEQKVAEGESTRESLAISEAKYKTIIDNLKDIIFTHDANGCVTYVTRSVEQYGYEVGDIIGRSMLDFVHPDDWPSASNALRQLLEARDEMTFVIKLLAREGHVRLMEDHAKAVVNDDGKVTHIVGVLRDITEKRAAEEALENMNVELEKHVHERTLELSRAYEDLKTEMEERKRAEDAKVKSEHLLDEVVNFLPDPTFVINRNQDVIVWNHAMEELTGVLASSILGKGDYEYALPFYGIRRPILIDYSLDATKRRDEKYLGITLKGDTLIAEAFTPLLKKAPTYLWGIAKPYYDAQGNILGAIESIRDVTHLKDTEFKLKNELHKFTALYELAVNMSAEKSLKHNLTFIVEKSRELLNTDTAFITLADETQQYLEMHTFSGIETSAFKRLRVPFDQGIGGLIMKTRKGFIINDYFNNKEIRQVNENVIRREGLISSMAVPVQAGEKSLGVLYVANRKATHFTQNDLDTLLLFGNLAAIEIVRERAESGLRESETKYRTVFENTGSAMIIIERNGILSLVNEEFARMTGFSKEEIEGKKRWKEFVVPEDIPSLAEASRKQILRQGEPLRQYEYRFVDRYGKTRNIILTADIIPGMQKSVAALADITNHKKVEEDLKKIRAELEIRVAQRTHELTVANEGLKELLRKQDVNIDLAKNILAMINSRPSRHTLLPNHVDLFFTAYYLPCYAEGGDHYFIKNISGHYPGTNKTLLSLKDQSGHEVSCILRSIITDLIHNALMVNTLDNTLEETITRLNREICSLSFFGDGHFFTAVNAEISHDTLKMRYVAAGHPPFLLIRNQDVACFPAPADPGRNLPAGILQAIDYNAGEIQLKLGDKLIFFTDGVTDIPYASGKSVLSADDLKDIVADIVRSHSHLPVSGLMARLFNRINGLESDEVASFPGFDDDITLLGLELEDGLCEYEDIIRPQNLNDFSSCVTCLLEKIEGEWQANGFASPEDRLHLVLEEAMVNAWKHGNHENPQKSIIVRRRYGNDAILEVIDEGSGFAVDRLYDPTLQPNLLNVNGRGNFIMRLLTEELQWQDGGRHLIAFFSRTGKSEQSFKSGSSFNLWRRYKKD